MYCTYGVVHNSAYMLLPYDVQRPPSQQCGVEYSVQWSRCADGPIFPVNVGWTRRWTGGGLAAKTSL